VSRGRASRARHVQVTRAPRSTKVPKGKESEERHMYRRALGKGKEGAERGLERSVLRKKFRRVRVGSDKLASWP